MKDGFTLMQYSVYTRHCASSESADAHEKRVNALLPPLGKVSLLRITDKQYGGIANFWGHAEGRQSAATAAIGTFLNQFEAPKKNKIMCIQKCLYFCHDV